MNKLFEKESESNSKSKGNQSEENVTSSSSKPNPEPEAESNEALEKARLEYKVLEKAYLDLKDLSVEAEEELRSIKS